MLDPHILYRCVMKCAWCTNPESILRPIGYVRKRGEKVGVSECDECHSHTDDDGDQVDSDDVVLSY
jgi:pyruvate-formate lyase-activating enzyme